jgi:polar amino acid transport system substrate-binding protein
LNLKGFIRTVLDFPEKGVILNTKKLSIVIDGPEALRLTEIQNNQCIRLALFLPQYAMDGNGALIPIGAGVVGHKLIETLAGQLNIKMQIVRQSSPPQAVETLQEGGCDVIIMGIEESRRKLVDFTPSVIQFDYAYLVPPGSPINEMSEVDRSGHRISVPRGHASWIALKKQISYADIVETELPDEAFALLLDGEAEVFALPREQLIDYAAMLSGSRVLTKGFGINDVGLAVAKGQSQFLEFLTKFVREAEMSGLVSQILDDAELTSRGFNTAK